VSISIVSERLCDADAECATYVPERGGEDEQHRRAVSEPEVEWRELVHDHELEKEAEEESAAQRE